MQQWRLINNSSQLNMFRAIILPTVRSTRLCVTACGIMYPRCCQPATGRLATSWVNYTTSFNLLANWLWKVGGGLFSPKKDPVTIVQNAGLTPRPVWTARNVSSPQGFDPRSVQHVASPRYLDRRQRRVGLQITKHIMWYFVFTTQFVFGHRQLPKLENHLLSIIRDSITIFTSTLHI